MVNTSNNKYNSSYGMDMQPYMTYFFTMCYMNNNRTNRHYD